MHARMIVGGKWMMDGKYRKGKRMKERVGA